MSVEKRDVAKLPSGRDDAVPVVEPRRLVLRRQPRRPRPRSLPESSRVPAFVSSLLLLPLPPLREDLRPRSTAYFRAMDLLHKLVRIVATGWRAGRDERAWVRGPRPDRPLSSRPSFAHTGGGLSGCVPGCPRRGGRRGHRPGVVPCRRPRARPLRPAAAVWAVAAPDRRQPRSIGCERVAPRRGRAGGRARAGAAGARRRAAARLARLSPEHRAVIVLRYLLDYTPGEIAELLELPRGTVNSRLRRGLDSLKERLE